MTLASRGIRIVSIPEIQAARSRDGHPAIKKAVVPDAPGSQTQDRQNKKDGGVPEFPALVRTQQNDPRKEEDQGQRFRAKHQQYPQQYTGEDQVPGAAA